MNKSNPTTQHSIPARLGIFIAVFLLLSSLAIVRDGRIFGHKIGNEDLPQWQIRSGSQTIINTSSLADDVVGYGGPVPVEIFITDTRIDSVSLLPNSETPGFLERVKKSGLCQAWNGMSIEEAARLEVDAVSGATYSSTALIANVRAGLNAVLNNDIGVEKSSERKNTPWKLIAIFLVIVLGAIGPFFIHNKAYRFIQQIFNVAILGFWAGVFIDYANLIGFFSNGLVDSMAGLVTILLFVVGFIFPLFGRHNWYCANVCPFGSLQDLAGHLKKRKLKIGHKTLHFLENVRQLLWVVLILLLVIGWGASWIDYEIFSGFIVESASLVVLIVGGVFVLMSIFVARPFCRFVCPTGSLFKIL